MSVERMEVSSTGDVKKELTGRARRKMSKMSKQPASIIVEEDSDARLNVSELVEKRRSELEAMLNIIHAPPSTRTALQRISRCKRRRASAHNLKRLPKSVRTLIVTNEYTERAGLKSYRRRKLAKREILLKEEKQSEGVSTPRRLSTHVWFAKRFHMIVKFGWHLPLCPTEKKLKHCMKICAGKVPGTVGFDFSFVERNENGVDKNLSRIILIGTLAEEVCTNSNVVIKREYQAGYVIAYMENENATKFITELIMSKNGHMGGLELWQLHRCARGKLTFPDDFPDCEEGRKMIKAELRRIDTQYRRKLRENLYIDDLQRDKFPTQPRCL